MANEHVLEELWETVQARRGDTTCYAGELLQSPFNLRQRFIQEAYEVLEAQQARVARFETNTVEAPGTGGFGTRFHVTAEAGDLLVHLYVLLASIDVTPDEVHRVMRKRFKKWFEPPVAD